MGVSTLAVAAMLALLELLVDFSAGNSVDGPDRDRRLTVLIRTPEPQPPPARPKDAASAPSQQVSVPADPVERRQAAVVPFPSELPAVSQPAKDWHAMAKAAARARVDDAYRSEESRASTWRETRSIMFKPGSEFVVKEEEPVLSDFRFIPRVHVLGLGVTIGSCFIGLPIVGVPIEQRTVAINLFVCATDSG